MYHATRPKARNLRIQTNTSECPHLPHGKIFTLLSTPQQHGPSRLGSPYSNCTVYSSLCDLATSQGEAEAEAEGFQSSPVGGYEILVRSSCTVPIIPFSTIFPLPRVTCDATLSGLSRRVTESSSPKSAVAEKFYFSGQRLRMPRGDNLIGRKTWELEVSIPISKSASLRSLVRSTPSCERGCDCTKYILWLCGVCVRGRVSFRASPLTSLSVIKRRPPRIYAWDRWGRVVL